MREYFIRRFLLIPPTLLGVTLLVFAITRFVPGGPVERALQEAQKATEEGGSSSGQAGGGMSEEQVEELEAINNPEDPSQGSRKIPFSRELYIEQEDFMEKKVLIF